MKVIGDLIVDGELELIKEVSYQQLKVLRDRGQLAAGCLYRIVDYTTTSAQSETQVRNHEFDVVVRALSDTTLSENAYAFHNTERDLGDLISTIFNYGAITNWGNIVPAEVGALTTESVGTQKYTRDLTPGILQITILGAIGVGVTLTDYTTGVVVSKSYKVGETEYNLLVPYSGKFVINFYALGDSATLNSSGGAKANLYSSYFAASNLAAWDIKYCLDNDTSRFTWADTTNGKGVIYFMRDEFGNECHYDFKNITFYRAADSDFGRAEGYYYTFSKNDANNAGTYIDGSLKRDSTNGVATDNIIDKDTLNDSNTKIHTLNNIVFICGTGNTTNPKSNKFDTNCANNTIGSGCYSNNFGAACSGNNIGSQFQGNTVGAQFQNNTIKSAFVNNSVGAYVIKLVTSAYVTWCIFAPKVDGWTNSYDVSNAMIGFPTAYANSSGLMSATDKAKLDRIIVQRDYSEGILEGSVNIEVDNLFLADLDYPVYAVSYKFTFESLILEAIKLSEILGSSIGFTDGDLVVSLRGGYVGFDESGAIVDSGIYDSRDVAYNYKSQQGYVFLPKQRMLETVYKLQGVIIVEFLLHSEG